jgi:predicted AAA+ superfamily ATPase
MALTNRDRVGQALDLLGQALKPYVERELKAAYGERWAREVAVVLERDVDIREGETHLDVYALLKIMWDRWQPVFSKLLSFGDRTLVAELRDVRNRWAHQEAFTTDDAYRALDSAQRLLMAISAGEEAAAIDRQKQELLRQRFEEQARRKKEQAAREPVEVRPAGGLRPWREIATPHEDVASGRYQQAEFAADLGQVVRGEAAPEYQDPREFFRRTFITGGLHDLLGEAVARVTGAGGQPVVALQTNFGGGKTHSLLALYHVFSGRSPAELPGVEQILADVGVSALPEVRRAVLVGTHISPARVYEKPDGTKVQTLWGELAWQLAGREGYEHVAEADARRANPGDGLFELFRASAPCLVLIDEWVAYARQLYTNRDLPAGDFDTHFSFAQALTEAAKGVPGTLLVVSIPASDREIGGEGGKEALQRLENVVQRADSPWRPATADEGFEIVRRRLFEHIEASPDRDAVIKAFVELYRKQAQEFPVEDWAAYEDRLRSAYPIHPELFDQLYQQWATLENFQLTRGVLRLMAAVISALWEQQDPSLLIMPSSVPVGHPDVLSHLKQYLDDPWVGVIAADVDGPNSAATAIDRANPNLGRLSATRRVARAILLATAPMAGGPNPGVDDRRIQLGCVQPGEPPAIFGDALRRLAQEATHLYADKGRYWLDTKPTVTKTANQRAQQLSLEDDVFPEIVRRLREVGRTRGEFSAVHVAPASPADVPDEDSARLVILGPQHPHASGDQASPARALAAEILEERGTGPRRNRNMLVFLAADRTRLEDLERAVRQYLAWRSIDEDRDALNLDAFQRSQAEQKLRGADEAVAQRIPEAYCWLLVPSQPDPAGPIEWQQFRVQGQDALAVRASRKLKTDELLLTEMGPVRLRLELDRVPLWQGDHTGVKQLWEYFAQYLYLPRLRDRNVLAAAIQDGVASTTWDPETFAYAEAFDQDAGRYRGLRGGEVVTVLFDGSSVLVKPEVAATRLQPEPRAEVGAEAGVASGEGSATLAGIEVEAAGRVGVLRRFHGVADLDPLRVNKEAAEIVENVLQHLAALPGAEVEVTLEIRAEVPDGVPDNVVRTVTENARTLKFRDHGFERE